MKTWKAIAGSAAISVLLTVTPAKAGTEAYIGEVTPMAFNFCPRNTAAMDGQLLAISSNTALFSLIGTTYGGDGRTTFALPDLRGRSPMHVGSGPGLTPRTLGERSGSETNTLTIGNMPAHSHTATVHANNTILADSGNANTNIFALTQSDIYHSEAGALPNVTMAADTVTVGNTGGNLPVNNMSPYLVINYCIVTVGIFPSRP